MKQRTIIRARAKSCAEFYSPRGLSDVIVRNFAMLNAEIPGTLALANYYVHIYTVSDYPEEFVTFDNLADAECFARDVRKFGNLREALACDTIIHQKA